MADTTSDLEPVDLDLLETQYHNSLCLECGKLETDAVHDNPKRMAFHAFRGNVLLPIALIRNYRKLEAENAMMLATIQQTTPVVGKATQELAAKDDEIAREREQREAAESLLQARYKIEARHESEIAALKGRIEKLRERLEQIADEPASAAIREMQTGYESYLQRTAQDALAADDKAAKEEGK